MESIYPAMLNDSVVARLKTSYTELGDKFSPDYSKDRLVLQTNSNVNIIKLARNNTNAYKQYIDIISNDFLLISHHKDRYDVFMKRIKYHPEKLKNYSDLKRYKELIYTLTLPNIKKKSNTLPNRLLVLFSHMNGSKYDSSNAIERLFVHYFDDIQRSLVKNVFVLRLADLNLSHGSYYSNTENYPDYEEQIQGLIKYICNEYDIKQNNVVLYGGSKGGAGALLHGAIGDYKVVAGDPIINTYLYDKKDWHFVKNFKVEDLTDKIINYAKNNDTKKYIFASSVLKFNFDVISNLAEQSNNLIKVVDLSNDEMIKKHPQITSQSVPEQITLINLLFDGEKILGKNI